MSKALLPAAALAGVSAAALVLLACPPSMIDGGHDRAHSTGSTSTSTSTSTTSTTSTTASSGGGHGGADGTGGAGTGGEGTGGSGDAGTDANACAPHDAGISTWCDAGVPDCPIDINGFQCNDQAYCTQVTKNLDASCPLTCSQCCDIIGGPIAVCLPP